MKKHLLILSFSLLCPLTLPAQSTEATQATEKNVLLSVLPPEHTVLNVLTLLPEVLAAQTSISLSEAEKIRLESGLYEWNINAEAARRRVDQEGHFREYTVTLERPIRWFGKAKKDAELGEKTVEFSTTVYRDAWHEAARALLASWFNSLRDQHAVALLDQQVELYSHLLADIKKRMHMGDIPKLEVLSAETEYEQLRATLLQAQQRATLSSIALERKYIGLPPARYTQLTELPEPVSDTAAWLTRLMADNHAIIKARQASEKAQLDAERSALELTPDPTVALRYGSERSNEERIVGVAVSIPLPGQARHAMHTISTAQLSITLQNERQILLQAEQDAQTQIANFNNMRSVAEALSFVATKAGKNAELVYKSYTLGESPFADTLLAGRQAIEARQAAEDAHLNTLEAYARLLLDTHQIWRDKAVIGDITSQPENNYKQKPANLFEDPLTHEALPPLP